MNYIDSWFHFYDTTESFEQHRDKGLINPNSICFIKESGQVYTQNSFFGICRERYERLEQLAKELDDRFGETLAEIEQFERDINSDFNEFKELVGAPDGIAPLDRDSKIPAAYLPSYVDDVLEYATRAAFPVTGETGKIYVSLDDNLTYRWSGSTYIEISKSLGLGETSSTAYPGSKGKKNADDIAAHKIDYSNPHRVTKVQVGLGNVDNTSDLDKPVSNAAKTEFDSIKTRMNDLENNVSISYQALQGNLVGFASEVGEAMDTKVDKVEGKGLSTNDFTNEDKTKLTSALTSTSIISAGKVSGDLSNSKINLNNIFTERYPGDTRVYGTIPGANVSGTLTNAIMEGSKVSGELTNVTINAGKIIDYDNLGRLVTGIISGVRIRGNIEDATIDASHVLNLDSEINNVVSENNNIFTGVTIQGSQIQGSITNATINGSQIRGNIDVATIGGSQINSTISGSLITGDLTKALIHADKIGDTIDDGYTLGVIKANRLRGNLDNATISGSQVNGHLTNATIDSSNIKGTMTAEEILADYSITSTHLATGAVLPENIASGNLASGVKVNVNALVGNIPARRLQGDIDKERMRSGFLELCETYNVVYKVPGIK